VNCSVAVSLQADQTYFLKVTHFNSEWGTGAYLVKSETLPDDDHGDDRDNATVIESLPFEQSGRIDWGQDLDFYRLTAPATGSISMMTEGDIDPMCKIFDAEGELLQENDDIDAEGQNYNCRVDQQVEQGQELYLVVQPYTSERAPMGNAGAYVLIVRQQ